MDGYNVSTAEASLYHKITTPLSEYSTFDYEIIDFPNTIWYHKDSKFLLTNLAIFLPVGLIGLFGNAWVIYVLKSNRHIRTSTNLIVANMAVADMLSSVIYPCFIFVYDYFQNYELGFIGCKGEGPLECTILLASVISMSVITYDRLTAIVLSIESKIDKCKAKLTICATWVISILLSAPLGYFRHYRKRLWKNFDEKYCTEEVIMVNVYWYVIIAALVWLPLTIQIICYSAIFFKLNKYEKILVKTLNYNHRHQLGYKRSAARMMFIVILTFMLCRMPFTAFIIYRHQLLKSDIPASSSDVKNLADGSYHALWFSSKYLLIVNAAINPLIYSVTNVSFRNAFRKTKLCRWILTNCHQGTKPDRKPPALPVADDPECIITCGHKNIFHFLKKNYTVSSHLPPSTKTVEIFNTKL